MAHIESSPAVTVSRGAPDVGGEVRTTIVWVRGEHDLATRVHLSVMIAQAARLGDGDIAIDLSGVTFMDASTVGAIVGARNRLGAHRSLSVRDPSPRARWLLDLCGLMDLIDDQPAPVAHPAAALRTWVDVPATGHRSPASATRPGSSRATPGQEPARAAPGQQ